MAETVGQEEIIAKSSSGLVAEMQEAMNQFSKQVIEGVGFYLWTDPTIVMDLTKPLGALGGLQQEEQFRWGPWNRTERWYKFILDVDPFSMRDRGPGERLNTLMQTVMQVLLPLMPAIEQQGGQLDIHALLQVLARYGDMPEFVDLIKMGGVPLDYAPRGQQQSQGVMSSPNTTRNYVRRNVAAGPTAPNANQRLMESALSASRPQQPQGAA